MQIDGDLSVDFSSFGFCFRAMRSMNCYFAKIDFAASTKRSSTTIRLSSLQLSHRMTYRGFPSSSNRVPQPSSDMDIQGTFRICSTRCLRRSPGEEPRAGERQWTRLVERTFNAGAGHGDSRQPVFLRVQPRLSPSRPYSVLLCFEASRYCML